MTRLGVHSLGISTSQFRSVDELMARIATAVAVSPESRAAIGHAADTPRNNPAPTLLESLDPVSQLAFNAIAQAWHGANLHQDILAAERIALLLCSAWGQVDSTVAYLETMFADQGRYASPRQFTRSVHSSPTSLAAIEFGIHGPCQTLAHDAWPVCCVLEQALALLRGGHADAVVVCWADQASTVATDLCRRAVRDLHRTEFSRFTGMGRRDCGAVAAVVSCDAGLVPQNLKTFRPEFGVKVGPVVKNAGRLADVPVVEHGAYPTDGALHWASAGLAWLMAEKNGPAPTGTPQPVIVPNGWREIGHHGKMREIAFCPT